MHRLQKIIKVKGVSPIIATIIIVIIVLGASFMLYNFVQSIWSYSKENVQLVFHVAVYDGSLFVGGTIKNKSPHTVRIIKVMDNYGNRYAPCYIIAEGAGILLNYLDIKPYETIELAKDWNEVGKYTFVMVEGFKIQHYDRVILYFYLHDGTKYEVVTYFTHP